MRQRIFSTALLWAVVILLPLVLGFHGAVLLLLAFALLTQWEMHDMLDRLGYRPLQLLGACAATFLLLGVAYVPGMDLAHALAAVFIALALFGLFVPPTGQMLTRLLPTLLALVSGPFLLAFYVPLLQQSILLAVWVIAVTKFTDVGGLLVGMWLGKHKLAPAFSPKKTWEGAIGGVLTATLVGLLIFAIGRTHLPADFGVWTVFVLAPVLAVIGICADLFESAWKRECGVKDSGRLFPGIGGAFDLTDSLLFAAPVAVLILALLN